LRRLPRRILWRLGLTSAYGIEQVTFSLGLLRYLKKEHVDILHVQDPIVALMVQRANWAGLVPTRVVLNHGTEEPSAFLKKIRYVQHGAPWHLEDARREGAWKRTWTAIPNFIDTECFSPHGHSVRDELEIPKEAFVVLTAAAIKRKHKRVDHLINEVATARRAFPNLPVWLIVAGGRETETDELVRWGKELLGHSVRFVVGFPRERMAELYRVADVFALCSIKEMMPMAVLEATASGLPCLVNRHPVLEWMLGPGGKAIDMSAPGELADAIARLAGDRDHRAVLGCEARRHCVENFSRDKVVDQILGYYRFVLSHDRAAHCCQGQSDFDGIARR
jgi:glycosyltransferase involved in cell wall biosynthesis